MSDPFSLSRFEAAQADAGTYARAVLELRVASAQDVFGVTDASKLRSSMTLFARVCEEESVFHVVLARYFDGQVDVVTEARLESAEG